MMAVDERRPVVPVGPAVDPWEGHPLFPDLDRYRSIFVPVIVGPPVQQTVPRGGFYRARHRA